MVRVLIVGLFLSWLPVRWMATQPDHLFHIVFCNVGQGDAILISRDSFQMLVDGGRDDSVLSCLNQHIPPWDRSLEVMVATHPDADHITGLAPVLDSFQVKTIIHDGLIKQTADFDRFKTAVQKQQRQGAGVIIAKSGKYIKNGENIDIEILYPMVEPPRQDPVLHDESETTLSDAKSAFEQPADDANNHSVVLRVSYGKLDVLLTGDLEREGEAALLSGSLIKDVEVLKVGHHGAKTSSTPEFVGVVKPEISVISVGKNNSYGHPDPLTLQTLSREKSFIIRTDQESTIELVSDGRFLWKRKAR